MSIHPSKISVLTIPVREQGGLSASEDSDVSDASTWMEELRLEEEPRVEQKSGKSLRGFFQRPVIGRARLVSWASRASSAEGKTQNCSPTEVINSYSKGQDPNNPFQKSGKKRKIDQYDQYRQDAHITSASSSDERPPKMVKGDVQLPRNRNALPVFRNWPSSKNVNFEIFRPAKLYNKAYKPKTALEQINRTFLDEQAFMTKEHTEQQTFGVDYTKRPSTR